MTKMKPSKIAALVLLALSGPAGAQVYEMSFVDTNGATVVKSPSLTWYNPNGEISVTTISGLDRKVRVELLKGTTVLQSQTSGIITVANRIRASDNNEFYGVKLSLTKPSDGNYILRSTVLDIDNNTVAVNDYPFNVDTSGPTSSDGFTFSVGASTGGQVDVFGIDHAGNSLTLTGITDIGSGIASATYFTIDPNGVTRSKPTALTATVPASWNVKAVWAAATDVAPIAQGLYTIGLAITDRAGNIGKIQRQSYLDSVYPPYWVEVWNSAAGAWQPLANASSYENPIKFRIKMLKANNTNFNGSNFGYTNATSYSDATYAYIEKSTVVPQPDSLYWRLNTKAGLYSDVRGTHFDGVKLVGVSAAPKVTGIQYGKVVGGVSQQMADGSTVRDGKPFSIDRVTIQVEVRNYPQQVTLNNAMCLVNPGATSCTLNPGVSYSTGKGYIPYGINVANTQNAALTSFGGYLYTYWDFNPPVIDEWSYQQQSKTLTMRVTDNDRIDSWQIGMWDTRKFNAVAKNAANQLTTLPLTDTREINYKNKFAQFSTQSLPDGVYTLTGTATDIDGNTATQALTGVLVDSVGPVISITNKGGNDFSGVETLKDLRITLSDNHDTAPTITRMMLSGGPINDALDLGYSKVSDGWQPEVPRMFPTLEVGQEYRLSITAKDSHDNQTSRAVTLTLSPQNLVRLDGINVLATNQSLLDINDKPLGKISFKGALTDGGSQSRGPQAGYFTLRRDSAFAVMFNGTKVAPGETKDVVIPLDGSGSVTLPVWPADAGVTGKASYMLDIPQLTAN